MLAADLPLIGPEDLEALARLGECSSRLVVASPDRFEDGTNALLMRPPGVIPYALGPGSFKRHVARAPPEPTSSRGAGAAGHMPGLLELASGERWRGPTGLPIRRLAG